MIIPLITVSNFTTISPPSLYKKMNKVGVRWKWTGHTMDEFALNVKCWCEGYFICEYTIMYRVRWVFRKEYRVKLILQIIHSSNTFVLYNTCVVRLAERKGERLLTKPRHPAPSSGLTNLQYPRVTLSYYWDKGQACNTFILLR